jgi:hypothetical protein
MKKHIIILVIICSGIAWFVFHDSKLDMLLKKQKVTSSDRVGMKIVEQNQGAFDLDRYSEPGLITVMYFFSEQCPHTPTMDSHMRTLLKMRPDIAVRKFSLGNDWSKASAYMKYRLDIGATPFIVIYGPDGRVIEQDKGTNDKACQLLVAWINTEINREK